MVMVVKKGDGEDGKKDDEREAKILILQESLAEEPSLQCSLRRPSFLFFPSGPPLGSRPSTTLPVKNRYYGRDKAF